jgi:3-hydroxyisobutyrate dehydrogenase-like beta-hydroxyacid dehydrogenase
MSAGIAVVGIGAMGSPMACRLIEAGMDVSIFDVREERMKELVDRGARSATSPADAARTAGTVLVMVATGEQMHSAILGNEGAAHALSSGATVIVTCTVGVEAVQDLATALAAQNVAVADAAVSGGVHRAHLGELLIMVGASAEVLDRCRPVLAPLGSDIVHCGDRVGDGQAVKLVNQMLCGIHLAAAAESISYAAALGLDPQKVWDTVRRGAANSFMLEHRGLRMITGDDGEESVLSNFVKDLGLVVDAAQSRGFEPILSARAREVFSLGMELSNGHDDHAALLRSVRAMSENP